MHAPPAINCIQTTVLVIIMNGFIPFIGVTFVSLLFLITTSDASTLETKQTESSASELIFEAGLDSVARRIQESDV